MKKIVFINQASGYLTIDIVNAFVNDFDQVDLISSEIRVQDVPLDPKVRLKKTIKHSRKSNFHRLLRWSISSVHVFFLLLFRYRKYEVFYISIPPMAYLCSLVLGNKYSILIYDVYPDVLKLFGISDKNPIYRFWAWANKRVFKKAHRLYTISEGMKNRLSPYAPNKNIEVIYNWTGITNLSPVEKSDNIFVKEHDLLDKFVVQYSGNISPTHNVESIVHVAEKLKEHDNIFFLIIGRGQLFGFIENLITEKKLWDKIKMLPYQPDEMLKYSLASADLGIVVVGNETADLSIPSKIYNIQAAGVGILGIGPKGSELDKHLNHYDNGDCFEHDDLDGIASYIEALSKNPDRKKDLKKNSSLAAQDFTMANANKYLKAY